MCDLTWSCDRLRHSGRHSRRRGRRRDVGAVVEVDVGPGDIRGGEGLSLPVQDGDAAADPDVEDSQDDDRGQAGGRQWVQLKDSVRYIKRGSK